MSLHTKRLSSLFGRVKEVYFFSRFPRSDSGIPDPQYTLRRVLLRKGLQTNEEVIEEIKAVRRTISIPRASGETSALVVFVENGGP